MTKLEETLKCEGNFGFGGGFAMSADHKEPADAMPMYCSSGCVLSRTCWDKLRERTAVAMPKATAAFEELCKRVGGQMAEEMWVAQFGHNDPYIMAMAGNIEDGALVQQGKRPLERGLLTLAWPFHVQ